MLDSDSTDPSVFPPRGTRLESFLTVLAAIAVCLFYGWTANSSSNFFSFRGQRGDYYNLLTQGMLKGHLSMNAKPSPELLKLAPDKVPGSAPFLLDASFYHGRYYLYFGVTPVVTVFLPYALVTGQNIGDSFVAVLFAAGGYLVSLRLLVLLRRKYFPSAPGCIMPMLALLLGFGNCCAVTLRHPWFYEVAIACAFFFSTVFLFSIYRAMIAPKVAWAWLALGSLACGLSVGGRPNFAVTAILMVIPLGYQWRHFRGGRCSKSSLWAALFGAAVPGIICAAGLMLYNYLRFHDALEFGVKYQLSYPQIFQANFFLHNLKLYFFSFPDFSIYFPFITPILEKYRPSGYYGFENIHGQVWSSLFFIPGIFGGVLLFRRFRSAQIPALIFAAFFIVFTMNLIVICMLGGRANRYMVDFQPAFIFLAAMGCLVCASAPWALSRPRLWGVAFYACAGAVLFHNIFISLQLYDYLKDANPVTYQKIAGVANRPSSWFGKWIYPLQGPLEMDVWFAPKHAGDLEPLVVTGAGEYSDYLLVHYLADDRIRLILHHFDYPSVVSPTIAITPFQKYHLEIEMGSLYPPMDHPLFQDFSRGERLLVHRTAHVKMDGRQVFGAQSNFYDSSPFDVAVGKNPLVERSTSRSTFSGVIENIHHVGIKGLLEKKRTEVYGPVEMTVLFPQKVASRAPEPLVVTGEAGRADALYVIYVDEKHIQFGFDDTGTGGVRSDILPIDLSVPHRLKISMGSLFPSAATKVIADLTPFQRAELKSVVSVALDGRDVFRSRVSFHDADPRMVDIGSNTAELSSCRPLFDGDIQEFHRLPYSADSWAAPSEKIIGPIAMDVTFPIDQTGRNEPILITGATGKADVLAVSYLGDHSIRFVLDHWGGGSVASDEIPIDFNSSHHLEIDMGSLYPDIGVAELLPFYVSRAEVLRKQVTLTLDGKVVFSKTSEFHAAKAKEVDIGINRVNASTCEGQFSGRITNVSRPGYGELATTKAKKLDYGPILLSVVFPKNAFGQREPLVVTGSTGKADAVIIKYIDDRHVSLTWDHWGRGGPTSDPIEVSYEDLNRLEIDMGSLYPADSVELNKTLQAGAVEFRRTHLNVTLNGRKVFAASGDFYQVRASTVLVGSNDIAISGCAPLFTGSIERVSRPGVGPP